jgi:hypothetical protein
MKATMASIRQLTYVGLVFAFSVNAQTTRPANPPFPQYKDLVWEVDPKLKDSATGKLSEEAKKALLAGDISVKPFLCGEGKNGWCIDHSSLVKSSYAKLYAFLMDYAGYKGSMPCVTESEVEENSAHPEKALVRIHCEFFPGVPALGDIEYYMNTERSPALEAGKEKFGYKYAIDPEKQKTIIEEYNKTIQNTGVWYVERFPHATEELYYVRLRGALELIPKIGALPKTLLSNAVAWRTESVFNEMGCYPRERHGALRNILRFWDPSSLFEKKEPLEEEPNP